MSLEKYLQRSSLSSNKNHLIIREPLMLENKPKLSKRKLSKQKVTIQSEQYQTDIRYRLPSDHDIELQQLRKIIASCQHCRKKLPQFRTKKPKDLDFVKKSQGVQTQLKTDLFDLLEHKLLEIEKCSNLNIKQLSVKDKQIQLKEQELVDLEERFTRLIYKVSEDMFLSQRMTKEYKQLKAFSLTSENNYLPSYLKALAMDDFVKGCSQSG